ncbi:N-acetylgalactosamine 6-sulfate sulfatase GALNS [Lentisphaera araneosa HTCC2155]|jgi:arylsulfatase A-like enzyme|uniref:N-acetylgalactosamine 6-sulfate sulfatase GALNS n=1 Tax=Lentisphaera araneosa HTCC2155 TaxID=313628 RepID=A6DGK3_9BACT|nr:sulfatase [Lentisphaera araneosa]EDM29320.1 N-acetylgalactosamine 6-sulfate sulfatase GALNS [Lentisphaera araneosa HTCC2155]
MDKKYFFAVLCALTLTCWADQTRPKKPNIVLILVDDLGWQDVKCYDIGAPSPMETPNLDALAKKGVKFWQAYSPAPVCAPSRAAILSGHHPARGEMTSVAGGFPPHAGHPTNSAQIQPWYSSRMPLKTFSLAEAMKAQGYRTGHSGKWHISKNHYAYPQPFHHGFDYSVHKRGVQVPMLPDRLSGFATNDPKDPYRLDENGMPFDQPQEGAMTFIKENQDKPFFLYYATWLVHSPLVMRSEALLKKYEKKLGLTLRDEHKKTWSKKGQSNPFYCAMVEQLDYYLGQVFTHLEETDDPRWPGHKLVENTYIIFTSDNGGMEGTSSEIYTDNYPLDHGKISIKEGGVRVPFIISGPGISQQAESQVMVNGLDLYPTILSLIGAPKPPGKKFDGCDLTPLLKNNVNKAELIVNSQGKVRDSLLWHFPQSQSASAIRIGDYKLIRYYNDNKAPELYRLYQGPKASPQRRDIEEKINLANQMPEKVQELNTQLANTIAEMGGRLPYGNPNFSGPLANKEKAPKVLSHQLIGDQVQFTYQSNGAQVVKADLMYTPNGGSRDEEWLRLSAKILDDNKVLVTLPAQTSHYYLNLIDENNFLAIYPELDNIQRRKLGSSFSTQALKADLAPLKKGPPINFQDEFTQIKKLKGKVFISEDFEAAELPTDLSFTQGLSLSKNDSASGSQSLQFFESKELKQDWMPMLSYGLKIPSMDINSQFLISFNFKLDEDKPGKLSLVLRDHSSGERRILTELTLEKGAIKANGRPVIPISPGVWYKFDLSFHTGSKNTHFFKLSATSANGDSLSAEIPYLQYHFNMPDLIGFVGLGNEGSSIYFDNLIIRTQD